MGMFDGKKGLILGVANDRSIAWAIAQVIMSEGEPAALTICRTSRTTSGSGTGGG
jgi:enoyl-[acyl-carrier protein] reductase I